MTMGHFEGVQTVAGWESALLATETMIYEINVLLCNIFVPICIRGDTIAQ